MPSQVIPWIMTFNENDLDTNTTQLKEFCEFVLKEINSTKKKKKK